MRRIYLFSLITLVLSVVTTASFGQSCPKGVRYNCVYGCGRHTDNNKDGFCDFSFVTQPEKKEEPVVVHKDTTAAVKADTATGSEAMAKQTTGSSETGRHPENGQGLHNHGQGLHNRSADGQPASGNTHTEGNSPAVPGTLVTPPHAADFVPLKHEPVYDLIFVTALTLLLYFTTLILYRLNIIKRIHHRKTWNLILLLTFLVSCLFGLFLVIQINYNVAMSVYGTLLYWHVEVGIAMTLIAVIHIIWHFTYFKNMLKKW